MFLLVQEILAQAGEAVGGSGRSWRQAHGRERRFVGVLVGVGNWMDGEGAIEQLRKMGLEAFESVQ